MEPSAAQAEEGRQAKKPRGRPPLGPSGKPSAAVGKMSERQSEQQTEVVRKASSRIIVAADKEGSASEDEATFAMDVGDIEAALGDNRQEEGVEEEEQDVPSISEEPKLSRKERMKQKLGLAVS